VLLIVAPRANILGGGVLSECQNLLTRETGQKPTVFELHELAVDTAKKLSGNVFGVFHGEVGLYAAAG
jgi:hypothetical protein